MYAEARGHPNGSTDTADVFVHHSSIEMQGYRKLDEGQRVEFKASQGQKGLQADSVRPV